MSWGIAMVIIVALACVLVAAFVVYRLWKLRGGVPALMRDLPAVAGAGWRHGTLRYFDREMLFYRVTSVALGPDRRLARGSLEIVERRGPRGDELEIMRADDVVLRVRTAAGEVEISTDGPGATALLSWIESRPSARLRRGRRPPRDR